MTESSKNLVDLVIVLSHELATSLEMSWDTIEMRELWAEALDALADTRQILLDRGLPCPGVIESVLNRVRDLPLTDPPSGDL